MKKIQNALILSAMLCATYAVRADFGIILKSAVSDSDSTLTVRLYNQGAPSGPGIDASEAGDPVWLVFDLDGGGVFRPGALTGITYDGTVADLLTKMIQPGDHVIQTSVPGPLEGRISRALTGLPSSLQTGGTGANDEGGTVKPTVAILFDDASLTNGGTFGFDATVHSGVIPAIGNVDLRIGQDVYANTYNFTTGITGPLRPLIGSATAQSTTSNVVFSFSFTTASAISYRVQSATNLAAPIFWSDEGNAIAGTGSAIPVSITNSLPPLDKFFRVVAN